MWPLAVFVLTCDEEMSVQKLAGLVSLQFVRLVSVGWVNPLPVDPGTAETTGTQAFWSHPYQNAMFQLTSLTLGKWHHLWPCWATVQLAFFTGSQSAALHTEHSHFSDQRIPTKHAHL